MSSHSEQCEPFSYSNDQWSPGIVTSLYDALDAQRPYPHRAGLVVGSGGLPYLLPHLDLPDIYISDTHDRVIEDTLGRVALLQACDTWDNYNDRMETLLNREDLVSRLMPRTSGISSLDQFREELAATAALRDQFGLTRTVANKTRLHRLPGDIREAAAGLGGQLIKKDVFISFVNFTNIAEYLGNARLRDNRYMLCELVLNVLPLTSDVAIVDSSPDCLPTVYSRNEYEALSAHGA